MCRLLIVAALLLLVHPALARECGETLSRKNRVSNEVEIQVGIAAPAFYARSGNFVMLLDPTAVEATLMAHIADLHIADYERLLAALKKQLLCSLVIEVDLPLSFDTDIANYSGDSPVLLRRVTWAFAGLVEKGLASITNLGRNPAGQALSEVVVTHLDGHGEFRMFCESPNREIFEHTDAVE
jgi:hypothetical protein